jgi:outer membrane lipoprotein-sorting protein
MKYLSLQVNLVNKMLIFIVLLGLNMLYCPAQSVEEIIEKVDGYRNLAKSFALKVKISDYHHDRLKNETVFEGLFKGNEKSLLLCTKGKNKGMKVLMKGDYLWVSLVNSRRALRITPMQRLTGQASYGDVAKTAFSIDYTPRILRQSQQNIITIQLTSRRKGATYQKIKLYVDARDYHPIKADFFLLSGKHYKTAYYEDFIKINQYPMVKRIRILDVVKKGSYSIMEYLDYQKKTVPEKYFNVMYLPKFTAQ